MRGSASAEHFLLQAGHLISWVGRVFWLSRPPQRVAPVVCALSSLKAYEGLSVVRVFSSNYSFTHVHWAQSQSRDENSEVCARHFGVLGTLSFLGCALDTVCTGHSCEMNSRCALGTSVRWAHSHCERELWVVHWARCALGTVSVAR